MVKNKLKMSELLKNEDNIWEFVKCLFESYGGKQLVKHQIESYNDFLDNKISDIIEQYNPLLFRLFLAANHLCFDEKKLLYLILDQNYREVFLKKYF